MVRPKPEQPDRFHRPCVYIYVTSTCTGFIFQSFFQNLSELINLHSRSSVAQLIPDGTNILNLINTEYEVRNKGRRGGEERERLREREEEREKGRERGRREGRRDSEKPIFIFRVSFKRLPWYRMILQS